MKICLISFDNWGFNQHIADHLIKEKHDVTVIDFSKFKFQYSSFFHKIYNGLSKLILKRNLKSEFYGKNIISELEKLNEKQDVILTIKGDFISPKYAQKIKNFTYKSSAFFNDSIGRCPKILNVIDCFDEVFSFDKNDCENYNLKFKTNFIYTIPKKTSDVEFNVFNISSKDKRFDTILDVANYLGEKEISKKIMILNKQKSPTNHDLPNIDFITKPLSLEDINHYISKCKTVLDLQRKNQIGLTFRIFESMGHGKKLITTNTDIKNYDFYNPNNILILDATDPKIDDSFFNTPYEPIPEEVFYNYTISGWIKDFISN